jgi:hypothetical protein
MFIPLSFLGNGSVKTLPRQATIEVFLDASFSMRAISSSRNFLFHCDENQWPIHGHCRRYCACPTSCALRFPDSTHHFDPVVSCRVLLRPRYVQFSFSEFPVLRVFEINGDFHKRSLQKWHKSPVHQTDAQLYFCRLPWHGSSPRVIFVFDSESV